MATPGDGQTMADPGHGLQPRMYMVVGEIRASGLARLPPDTSFFISVSLTLLIPHISDYRYAIRK